jgi:hypothetical protein
VNFVFFISSPILAINFYFRSLQFLGELSEGADIENGSEAKGLFSVACGHIHAHSVVLSISQWLFGQMPLFNRKGLHKLLIYAATKGLGRFAG